MAIPTNTFCDDCQAYSPIPGKPGFGECRASIPVILDTTIVSQSNKNAVWPVVAAGDWCVFGRVMIALDGWPVYGPVP